MNGPLIGLTLAAYMALLFAVAWHGDRRAGGDGRFQASVQALSLAVYCTTWTFFGAVGSASVNGWLYLPIYLGPALVFLLGMPRSGTSLVEQILASHADVFGAGEVNLLRPALFEEFPQTEGQSVGEFIKGLRDEDLARAGERYTTRLGALGGGAKFVTDKYLNNFWYAGLIRLMLPEATLIHCRRDPLDTCVSCWTNLFGGELRFAYDLAEIGRYYRIYDRLMKHWAKAPDVDLVEVHYEELVTDPDGQIARLLEACGLDPHPACARFFETERFVGTLSALQVRQPAHTGSVGRAARFEGRLAPLIEALGPLAKKSAKPAVVPKPAIQAGTVV